MLAMEKKNTNLITARLRRRLEGRNRLMGLAAENVPVSEAERELQRLRAYLLEWSHNQSRTAQIGRIVGSPLAEYMKTATREAVDWLGASDGWAMAIIDSSIDDLVAEPDGMLMRGALRARYLNEGISAVAGVRVRVFRSGRLQHMSLIEADALADRAELAMLPTVKRKGLPL